LEDHETTRALAKPWAVTKGADGCTWDWGTSTWARAFIRRTSGWLATWIWALAISGPRETRLSKHCDARRYEGRNGVRAWRRRRHGSGHTLSGHSASYVVLGGRKCKKHWSRLPPGCRGADSTRDFGGLRIVGDDGAKKKKQNIGDEPKPQKTGRPAAVAAKVGDSARHAPNGAGRHDAPDCAAATIIRPHIAQAFPIRTFPQLLPLRGPQILLDNQSGIAMLPWSKLHRHSSRGQFLDSCPKLSLNRQGLRDFCPEASLSLHRD